MDWSLVVSIASALGSIASVALSIYVYRKGISDKKQNDKTEVLAVTSPERLVSQRLGVTYLEAITVNYSSMPIAIINATIHISAKNTNLAVSASAYFFPTTINTINHKTGSTLVDSFTNKSDALPITIAPLNAKSYTLAFPTPGIMGVAKEGCEISVEMETSRSKAIILTKQELLPKQITLEKYLIKRARQS